MCVARLTLCEAASNHVTVKTLPVVKVTMAVEIPTGGFFEEDAFVSNVAALLGIELARIRIVSIVAGRRSSSMDVALEIGVCQPSRIPVV